MRQDKRQGRRQGIAPASPPRLRWLAHHAVAVCSTKACMVYVLIEARQDNRQGKRQSKRQGKKQGCVPASPPRLQWLAHHAVAVCSSAAQHCTAPQSAVWLHHWQLSAHPAPDQTDHKPQTLTAAPSTEAAIGPHLQQTSDQAVVCI